MKFSDIVGRVRPDMTIEKPQHPYADRREGKELLPGVEKKLQEYARTTSRRVRVRLRHDVSEFDLGYIGAKYGDAMVKNIKDGAVKIKVASGSVILFNGMKQDNSYIPIDKDGIDEEPRSAFSLISRYPEILESADETEAVEKVVQEPVLNRKSKAEKALEDNHG